MKNANASRTKAYLRANVDCPHFAQNLSQHKEQLQGAESEPNNRLDDWARWSQSAKYGERA